MAASQSSLCVNSVLALLANEVVAALSILTRLNQQEPLANSVEAEQRRVQLVRTRRLNIL